MLVYVLLYLLIGLCLARICQPITRLPSQVAACILAWPVIGLGLLGSFVMFLVCPYRGGGAGVDYDNN